MECSRSNSKVIVISTAVLLAGITANLEAAVITASSCSQADVQNAINAANDGDIVSVPAGTGSWASEVTIGSQIHWNPNQYQSKQIVLQGAGMDSTIIVSGTGTVPLGIIVVDGKPIRVTGFTIKGMKILSRTEPALEISGHDFRIDHCTFGETGKAGTQGRGIIAYSTRGLIDHCIFIDTKQGIEIDGDGDAYGEPVPGTASWSRPLNPGTLDALYVEDCTFNYSEALDGAIDTYSGARYVFRHNTLINTQAGGHGRDSGGLRSPLWFEYYFNTFTSTLPGGPIRALFFRGGTGVLFNNTWTGNYGSGISVVYYCACPSYFTSCGWPTCTAYPCTDQTGRGPDMNNDGVQDVVPLYEWNDTINGANMNIGVEEGGCNPPMSFFIQAGRDYFNDTPRPGYTPYVYPHPLTLGTSIINVNGHLQERQGAFSVLLNRFKSSVVLTFHNQQKIAQINVYAMDGRKIMSMRNIQSDKVELKPHGLAKGIYALELQADGELFTQCIYVVQ